MRILAFVLTLSLLAACSSPPQTNGTTSPQSIPLEIIQIIDMKLATGEHLYILEYRTLRSIEDVASLAREAESLWPTLRPKSEAAGHSSAGIRAVEQPTGELIQQAQAYTFIWQKGSSGDWQRLHGGG